MKLNKSTKCKGCNQIIPANQEVETVQIFVQEITSNSCNKFQYPKEFYCPFCGEINSIEQE